MKEIIFAITLIFLSTSNGKAIAIDAPAENEIERPSHSSSEIIANHLPAPEVDPFLENLEPVPVYEGNGPSSELEDMYCPESAPVARKPSTTPTTQAPPDYSLFLCIARGWQKKLTGDERVDVYTQAVEATAYRAMLNLKKGKTLEPEHIEIFQAMLNSPHVTIQAFLLEQCYSVLRPVNRRHALQTLQAHAQTYPKQIAKTVYSVLEPNTITNPNELQEIAQVAIDTQDLALNVLLLLDYRQNLTPLQTKQAYLHTVIGCAAPEISKKERSLCTFIKENFR